MNVAAIVPAAGRSSRMGQSNKLLLGIQGVPMISVVAQIAVQAGFSPVLVVTGADNFEISRAVENLPVDLASNPDRFGGMARSLSIGISALPQKVEGCIIMLGDMPMITKQTVIALRRSFENERCEKIIYPVHGNKQGNPVIFPQRYFNALCNLPGDMGGKKLLEQFRAGSVPVEINSDEIFFDVNTQSDYEILLDKMKAPINV